MTRSEIVEALAALKPNDWRSACARVRWIVARREFTEFDEYDLPPALVKFLQDDKSRDEWPALRKAVTNRRRAKRVRLKRNSDMGVLAARRERRREYMREYRRKKDEDVEQ